MMKYLHYIPNIFKEEMWQTYLEKTNNLIRNPPNLANIKHSDINQVNSKLNQKKNSISWNPYVKYELGCKYSSHIVTMNLNIFIRI